MFTLLNRFYNHCDRLTTIYHFSFVNNEHDILLYLAYQGPVIAAFNALPWQFYLNGIIQYNCDGQYKHLNHAAQIVGYDLT